MLQIYGPARSRVMRVIWLAEELGIPYELKSLNMREGEHRRPPYTDINPNGKVPAIIDGDLKLCESGAILNYLAEKHAKLGKNLIPLHGTKERALHDQWMFFALSDMEPPLWAWFKQVIFVPEEKRSRDLHEEAKENFARSAAVVSQHLKTRPHMLGDAFGVTDILVSGILGWGKATDLPGFDDTLNAYMSRTRERPAFKSSQEKYPPA